MKRFEYRVITFFAALPLDSLNALGDEGWRIAVVVPRSLEGLADAVVLMREKGEA